MKRLLAAISLCTFTAVSTALPASAELFVFPKNGQTKEQQEQDEFSCYKWAKDQTGFDPNKAVEHVPELPDCCVNVPSPLIVTSPPANHVHLPTTASQAAEGAEAVDKMPKPIEAMSERDITH